MKHLLPTLHDYSWLVRKALRHYAVRGEESRTCSKGGGSVPKVINILQALFTHEKLIYSCSVACKRLPRLHSCLAGCQTVLAARSKNELPYPFIFLKKWLPILCRLWDNKVTSPAALSRAHPSFPSQLSTSSLLFTATSTVELQYPHFFTLRWFLFSTSKPI